jgi:glycosyltransferase involved in cell wall biosynthesis
MKPILSIIIPTKNRYTYLESCLRAISVNYNRQDVEIIITDNSSVKQNIKSLSLFSNICYSYSDIPISQVENFEYAISKVSGEYVTMIGDDDGISNLLIEVVEFMDRNSINALISPFVSYYWPDIISKNIINNFSGKMYLDTYTFEINEIDALAERKKCLLTGGTSLCELPRMYYGIIKKDILDKVKLRAGSYFPGPSPDMANAFSISEFASKFVKFDAPLFIAGNSAKSAAGLGLAGKHIGIIEDHPLLPKNCSINWTKEIPKYWSGQTIWAESVVNSINRSSNQNLLFFFNYEKLYASCKIYNPEYIDEINLAIKYYKSNNSSFLFEMKIYKEIIFIWILRFKNLFKNLFKRFKISSLQVKENIESIEEASKLLYTFESRIKEMIK